jgi:drug/metabolite transporter (DMT)-like permease
VQPWVFPATIAARDRFSPDPGLMAALYGGPRPALNLSLAVFLHRYQLWVYTPGPVMALCLVIAIAGILRSVRVSRRQLAGALLAVLGVVVVLGAVATVQFTWRYVLPTLALLPPAAALSAGSVTTEIAAPRD